MRATPKVRFWMHQMHDETGRLMHQTGHMLHEKAFWEIVGIVVMIAAMFTLLVRLGVDPALKYRYPQYIW